VFAVMQDLFMAGGDIDAISVLGGLGKRGERGGRRRKDRVYDARHFKARRLHDRLYQSADIQFAFHPAEQPLYERFDRSDLQSPVRTLGRRRTQRRAVEHDRRIDRLLQSAQKRTEVSVEAVYLNGENEHKSENVIFAESLRTHLDKNDIDGAIKLFDTLPAKLASDKELKILKASLLLSAGKPDEASHISSELLKSNGGDMDVLELNAQLALASGNKQKIQQILKQILEVEPNNAFANILLSILSIGIYLPWGYKAIIDKIVETYQFRREDDKRYSRRVSMEEIEKNGYNLNISRYASTAPEEEVIDIGEVAKELRAIENDIKNAKNAHNVFLKELGLEQLP